MKKPEGQGKAKSSPKRKESIVNNLDQSPEESASKLSGPASRRVPKGFTDRTGDAQDMVLIGGLPGEPHGASAQVPEDTGNKPTQARLWPVPKGCRVADDEPGGDRLFIGGFPCAPPKKPK